jgi:hypothetical protein
MKNARALVLAASICLAGNALFAQGTAFTYQGQLQNNGSPVTGNFNFIFSLFNTNTGGLATAGPVTNNGVVISNGLFTVLIDFGAGAFTGATNWMEISVATNGASAFTSLTPRQQLTPIPYAIMASNALSADTITGSVPNGSLNGSYTMPVTFNNASNIIGGTFSGNGFGLTNLNASQLTSGVISNIAQNDIPSITFSNIGVGMYPAYNTFTITTIENTPDAGPVFYASSSNNVMAFDLEPGPGSVADTGNGTVWMDIVNTNVQTTTGGIQPAQWLHLSASTNAHSIASRAYGGASDLPFWIGFDNVPQLSFSNNPTTTITANTQFNAQDTIDITGGWLILNTVDPFILVGADCVFRTDGTDNIAVGAQSGGQSGSENASFGYEAMQFTAGSYNVAQGYIALRENTSGNYNTASGAEALQLNTNGSYNTAVGGLALSLNLTGSYNTAIGFGSLQNNTNGVANIALGYEAGLNITTGSDNIDIGNVGAAADTNVIRIGAGQSHAIIAGVVTTTNGFASYAGNLSTPTIINVGNSPFTHTNTSGQNVEVFIGGGRVTAFAVNGAMVATDLALTGLTTVFLENNETLQVTYSSPPKMTFLIR